MLVKEHCAFILEMSLGCLQECPSRDVHCGWIQLGIELSREVVAEGMIGMRCIVLIQVT